MRSSPEPGDEEFLAAVATARVVLGPRMHVQAPPNLSDPAQRLRLLDAGIDDWGGVSPITPDHVNPEKPWPSIDVLRETTAGRGKTLLERLTVYPEFAAKPDPFLAGKMRAPVTRLLGGDGRANEGQRPAPIRWQDPDVRWKPRTIALTFSKGRRRPARGCRRRVRRSGSAGHDGAMETPPGRAHTARGRDPVRADEGVSPSRALR